jgi:hypothetical protein
VGATVGGDTSCAFHEGNPHDRRIGSVLCSPGCFRILALTISAPNIYDCGLPHTGVATGAIADYGKELAITRALVKQSPANTQWQRDVFLSLTKIGDLKAQAGDTTAATASYGEAVAIARRLAALDPSNPSLRPDLAQGLCKTGDVTLGDADKDARVAYYEEGLEIMRGLVRRDPRNCLATGSSDEPEQGWRCQAA